MSESEIQNTNRNCPKCGAELASAAPDQPCPACLMQLGLASWQSQGNAGRGDSLEPTQDSKPRPFQPPTPDELSGLLPNLEILELLGHGGMGAVYKARQASLDRIVAIKLIRPDAVEVAGFAERFTREAWALAKLNHPNIVTVHDFGKTEGDEPQFYLVMEYVEGTDLRQLIEGGELTPEQALTIVPPLCEALQFAHDAGIVHRDIKPENILIDASGRVKIADFGLARLAGSEVSAFTLTGTRQIMGTLRYMAPEQMEASHAVDHRADIYSLGVVFYEMLTGQVPAGHFDPPSKKVQIDVRLDEVVLRSLAREPERRYQQASEVKSDVEVISRSDAILSREANVRIGRGNADPNGSSGDNIARLVQQVQKVASSLFWLAVTEWVLVTLTLLVGTAVLYFWDGAPSEWKKALWDDDLTGGIIAIEFWTTLHAIVVMTSAHLLKRLRFWWLGLTSSVLVMIFPPANLAGLPIGIWSLVVLCSNDVRRLFESVRQGHVSAADSIESSTPEHPDEAPPRFSGTVIGGVVSFLLLAVPSAGLAAVSWPMWQEPGVTWINWPWPWLGVSLAGVALTIIGVVSINEIRNSNGQIYGLGFAIAEALAFPLLIINGALFGVLLYFNYSGLEMNFAMSLGLAVGETALLGGWLSSEIVKRV